MPVSSTTGTLEHIPVDRIRANPDNPRITFRQSELDELQESIRIYGIQVPIAVYRDGRSYVLIDGERRWRCASKLNHKTVPALVQDEPSKLDNLLLMFNIHSLREQWDLLTIAMKLPQVIQLLASQSKKRPTEAEISQATGLARGVIRRCKLLMELPEKYKRALLDELKKPKTKQRLSEDFFIEMEKALSVVERNMPQAIPVKDDVRDRLIDKYQGEIIRNIVDLRKVAKIARAEDVGGDAKAAAKTLTKLFSANTYSIEQAFEDSVAAMYSERDIASRIDSLLDRLREMESDEVDEDVRRKLEELIVYAKVMLEERD